MIQPTDGVLGIGSGGNYAVAAARALIGPLGLSAARDRPRVAGDRRRHRHLHQHATSSVEELPCADLTPRQIVAELDRHIVGQDAAKRAVAIAIRNRWRRQQLARRHARRRSRPRTS